MNRTAFILLIHEASSEVEPVREALLTDGGFRLQSVTRLSAALARIAGGGVDGIVLDLISPERGESEKLADFLTLKREAPDTPIVVVCGSEDDPLMRLTARVGASASLHAGQCKTGLSVVLRGLIEARAEAGDSAASESREHGTLVSVLGSKGGVGTTTVALNVACALAQEQQVILAEVRPALGTLSELFKVREKVRDLASFKPQAGSQELALVEACLWRYRRVPGLRILFGPQASYPEKHLDVNRARVLARALCGLADYVIADLAPGLSEPNRAFIEASACMVIVIERDPVCLEAARSLLRVISSWETAPQCVGAVVVSHAAVATPVPVAEFETRLDIPIFAVIPPAPDACLAAQRNAKPLLAFDSDNLASQSMIDLAHVIRQTAGPVHFGQKLVAS